MSDFDIEEPNLGDEVDTDLSEGIDEENYHLGYQIGFDAGFIQGFDQGQSSLNVESESSLYNIALDDIITQVDKFDFVEKHDMLMVLQLLRRV